MINRDCQQRRNRQPKHTTVGARKRPLRTTTTTTTTTTITTITTTTTTTITTITTMGDGNNNGNA